MYLIYIWYMNHYRYIVWKKNESAIDKNIDFIARDNLSLSKESFCHHPLPKKASFVNYSI